MSFLHFLQFAAASMSATLFNIPTGVSPSPDGSAPGPGGGNMSMAPAPAPSNSHGGGFNDLFRSVTSQRVEIPDYQVASGYAAPSYFAVRRPVSKASNRNVNDQVSVLSLAPFHHPKEISACCRAIFNLLLGCACLLGFMLFRWLGVQFYESRVVCRYVMPQSDTLREKIRQPSLLGHIAA